MKQIPESLRRAVGENLMYCRKRRFPGKGGSKQCADALGVSQQQWSPWELGKRMPNETRLGEIAKFFDTTVEWLRERHDFHKTHDGIIHTFGLGLERTTGWNCFSVAWRVPFPIPTGGTSPCP